MRLVQTCIRAAIHHARSQKQHSALWSASHADKHYHMSTTSPRRHSQHQNRTGARRWRRQRWFCIPQNVSRNTRVCKCEEWNSSCRHIGYPALSLVHSPLLQDSISCTRPQKRRIRSHTPRTRHWSKSSVSRTSIAAGRCVPFHRLACAFTDVAIKLSTSRTNAKTYVLT